MANVNKSDRYIVMAGENCIEVDSTDNLNEAKSIAIELDNGLSGEEWEECKNHWIYDVVTEDSIDPYED